MDILQACDLKKTYGTGEACVHALDGVSLNVEKGEFVAIVGTSGSGKSTLLHMLGGLDRPSSGKVFVDGKDIFSLKDEELTIFRRRKIGFVFQAYNLVPVLNVYENIVLPIELDGGKVDAGKSGKTVQVKGSVWPDDTCSGNAVCEKVITTIANDYTVASPYVQVNPDQVNYLGSTAMMIKNLQGSLKAGQLNSYHVTFNIPARMFVDSITLPKFDNASYKLYINGNQMDTRNSKIYVNDKAANISMDITPSGDFFSQSQDMVIDMRNTVNQSGDNKVSVSVLAVCGNGCEFNTDSNAVPIKYQEQTVTPSEPDIPETPSEPEQPDTAETPTLPNATGTDTKKNNHQTTVKKNDTVTSLDLIKEDSDDTNTKKETVVDLSGVNLQSAKATKNSINTFSNPNATKKSTSLAGLNSERIQTTDIQDFENSEDANDNQDIKDQVASTDDGITDDSSGSHESAAQKAKETVSDNRGVQLGLIIGGILFAGIVIVILVSRRMGKEEISAVTTKTEISQTAEEQEDGSLDQSKEQHADDIKEPKP